MRAVSDGYTSPGPSRIAAEEEVEGRERMSPGRTTGMLSECVCEPVLEGSRGSEVRQR